MKYFLFLIILFVSCGKVDTSIPIIGREYVIPTNLIFSDDDKSKIVSVCNALVAKKQSFLSTSKIFEFNIDKRSCTNEIIQETAQLKVINDIGLRFVGTTENVSENFFSDVVTKDHEAMYFLCNQMDNPTINNVNSLTSQLKVIYEIDNQFCSGIISGSICVSRITVLNIDQSKEKFVVINTEKFLIETRSEFINRGVVILRHREEECAESGMALSFKSTLKN